MTEQLESELRAALREHAAQVPAASLTPAGRALLSEVSELAQRSAHSRRSPATPTPENSCFRATP